MGWAQKAMESVKSGENSWLQMAWSYFPSSTRDWLRAGHVFIRV